MRCQAECLRGGAAASFAGSNIEAPGGAGAASGRNFAILAPPPKTSQAADAHSRAPERPLRRRQDVATLAHRNAQPG